MPANPVLRRIKISKGGMRGTAQPPKGNAADEREGDQLHQLPDAALQEC